MKTKALVVSVLLALWTASAVAEEMQPVTVVSTFDVKLGKEQEFLDLVNKLDAPLFDELMAAGKVLSWGVSVPVMHEPGMPSHAIWWSMPSMAEMDVIMAKFEAQERKILEEDPTFFQKLVEMTDLSKHHDACYRDMVFGHGEQAPPDGERPYTWMFTAKVHPGHEQDYLKLWNEHTKPILDQLVADGTVYAYGLSMQEIRRTDKFSHFTWVSVPSFAAYEKARAIYRKQRMAMSPEERGEYMEAALRTYDPDASRTYVFREEVFHLAKPME